MKLERWWLVAIAVVGAVFAATIVLLVRSQPHTAASCPEPAGLILNGDPQPGAGPTSAAATTRPSNQPGATATATPGPTTTTTQPGGTQPTTPPKVPTTTMPPAGPQYTTVPYVIYDAQDAAINQLHGAGLVVDVIPRPGAGCWVMSEDPAAGTQVLVGSTVRIEVGTNTPNCNLP